MPIKPIRLFITLILASFTFFSYAQIVIVPVGINLPQDTLTKKQLISSLNGFLSQKEQPNKENKFVLEEDLLETSALLDEIKGMEKNIKLKDNDFYKCYLTNIVKLDEDNYVVQFSYVGIKENTPVLRASFKLLAKREGSQFYFYSPLKQNTISWKIKKMGNVTYHFKDTLPKTDAKKYLEMVNFYDRKLKASELPIAFYYCDNLPEVLQLTGIDYKADYNGSKSDNLSSHEINESLLIVGGSSYHYSFDIHDLWHERLRYVMSSDITNRPVDEGCAYLYGGSWGVAWQEVLTKFKKYAADNPNADWLALYLQGTNFADGGRPMKVSYALNALIVQKIEKEKGFEPVMKLLGCGKKEQGDDNYFKALEKVTSINKANFNGAMWELIKGS
jgi:hypothetical protein